MGFYFIKDLVARAAKILAGANPGLESYLRFLFTLCYSDILQKLIVPLNPLIIMGFAVFEQSIRQNFKVA